MIVVLVVGRDEAFELFEPVEDDVCFLRLPPAFAAVPQYLVHTPVELPPLSEPDKRLSHTSGSSVAIQQVPAYDTGFRISVSGFPTEDSLFA